MLSNELKLWQMEQFLVYIFFLLLISKCLSYFPILDAKFSQYYLVKPMFDSWD